MIRAGQLRHKVLVSRGEPSRDATGAELVTWREFTTVNAEVVPVSGREYFGAAQVNATTTVRVRMRPLKGLKVGDRLTWRSSAYVIQAILDVEGRNRETEVVAVQVVTP